MNYNTVYVGMDVHKESFTLCSMTIEDEKASHYQKTEADYKKVLKYLEFLRTIYGDNDKEADREYIWAVVIVVNELCIIVVK